MSIDTALRIEQLEANISKVVLGKPDVVRHCLVALLAGEHILLEDVPGVGKTLIGKTLARSISGIFRRVQFTPDLLPADITGSSLFDTAKQTFVFTPGPVFANILLADEINRTTPRTQSALLEAMSERQVSSDGQTHPLPQPSRSWSSPRRIPWNSRGLIPCPKRSSTAFSCGFPSAIPIVMPRSACSAAIGLANRWTNSNRC
jgi:MoxR-like ATPase